MKRWILTFILSVSFSSLSYGNFNDQVNAYKQDEKVILDSQKDTINEVRFNEKVVNSYHQFDQLIDQGKKQLQSIIYSKAPRRNNTGGMLLVSFSMPKSLLIQMIDQAHDYNIPVVIRGLIDNDFKKTVETILEIKDQAINKHLKFDGIRIDPVWFKQFDIKAVPALVVTKRPSDCIAQKLCPNQKFDVVYGNQSIKDSLIDIQASGSNEIKSVAQSLLNGGHHG
ncbi:type-F conjugative transfer system pilin assembly protein TrbC [Thiotrichales bacterium 19S11-10]|nr:type-F conjugative transfer system pilin assembly protein TrbC [Thiotrichales bacterium 19S11-10]